MRVDVLSRWLMQVRGESIAPDDDALLAFIAKAGHNDVYRLLRDSDAELRG